MHTTGTHESEYIGKVLLLTLFGHVWMIRSYLTVSSNTFQVFQKEKSALKADLQELLPEVDKIEAWCSERWSLSQSKLTATELL